MGLKVKICGMRDPDNIAAVARYVPDWLGFIFYPNSLRFVGKAFELPADLPSQVDTVGVFVNEDIAVVKDTLQKHRMTWVQLHGDESPDYCSSLGSIGVKVIKAFSIGSIFDFRSTEPYNTVAAYFLFDTKDEAHGGSGRTFDWSTLDRYTGDTGFLLSGGLGLGNLDRALSLQHPMLAGLDLNSGVEIGPGVKDVATVHEAIQKVKRHKMIV